MLLTLTLALAAPLQDEGTTVAREIDAFVDHRHEAPPTAHRALRTFLHARGIDTPEELEVALRAPRETYPDLSELLGRTTTHAVECHHVDYATEFVMFVPRDYDPTERHALVVVGHGGNSSMSEDYATSTARSYLAAYAPELSRALDTVVVAPISERGWGPIGYSLIFSTISRVKRMANIDPDRVYLTGHSMGGHLSYRMALLFPGAFGAVSPHSGGYDFVEKGSIANLFNVPGRAIFGAREPYGINRDNKTNAKWAKERGLPWTFVEKGGGHEIYQDELAGLGAFFREHPRDPYPERVVFRQGGAMHFTRTWEIEGWPEHEVRSETRPMRWNRKHWLEVEPRPDADGPLEVVARNAGGNRIEVTSNRARRVTVDLHPRMVDLGEAVTVVVNGEVAFEGRVEADMGAMLDRARMEDDRGAIYWARVEVEPKDDHVHRLFE